MSSTLSETVIEAPLLAYLHARSAGYASEYFFLNTITSLLPGARKPLEADAELLRLIRARLRELLRMDAENIRKGVYPPQVLWPESPLRHASRLVQVIADGASLYRRRARGRTTEFDSRARGLLEDVPRYYRRNFHFQTNGYLSERSAEIYEHQVEMLFSGTADPMRRLVIPELRRSFGSSDGSGLRFLEIGAGTGRATRFVRQAFPKAKIVALDLSDPYLKVAQRRLSKFNRVDFVQGDGGHLPFESGLFDAVYSVFLFHELPRAARAEVFAETARVLKPGGLVACVDSLQAGDVPRLDPIFQSFPKNFHEPFFRDYFAHPLEKMLAERRFTRVRTGQGFLSKVCSAHRER